MRDIHRSIGSLRGFWWKKDNFIWSRGFQTPNVRRYDWTPKACLNHQTSAGMTGRLGYGIFTYIPPKLSKCRGWGLSAVWLVFVGVFLRAFDKTPWREKTSPLGTRAMQ